MKQDVNRTRVFRLVTYFLLMAGVLGTIYIFTNFLSQGRSPFTVKYLLLFVLLSIPLSILTDCGVEKTSACLAGVLTGWSRRRLKKGEIFSADLQRARHSKRQARYEEALDIINGFLKAVPDFPEALFLKAEIQWAGFGKASEAKRCLEKVMEITQNSEPLYSWASNYYNDIVLLEGEEARPAQNQKCA